MNQNPAISEQPVNPQNNQQVQQKPKKKVRQTFTLKPQHFEKRNGIQELYKLTCSLDLKNGADNVQQSMKKITSVLKTWNFNMAPRYQFELFLQRCKALGNHKFTQAYMSKVRRIHKGEDTWDSEVPQQIDPLNNVNLDHLNPNQQQNNQPQQTLQKKVQNAMKLIHEIENRSFKQHHETVPQKMEIEKSQMNHSDHQLDEEEQEDDCEMLLKQMDELQKQKKLLFSKTKEQQSSVKQNNEVKKSTPQSEDEQVPYVPDGYEDIDYGESSQNY